SLARSDTRWTASANSAVGTTIAVSQDFGMTSSYLGNVPSGTGEVRTWPPTAKITWFPSLTKVTVSLSDSPDASFATSDRAFRGTMTRLSPPGDATSAFLETYERRYPSVATRVMFPSRTRNSAP